MNIGRTLIGMIELIFAVYISSDDPGRISSNDPQNVWVTAHCVIHGILGLCVIICSLRRLYAISGLGIIALCVTYVASFSNWQSGNDGGGLFWLLIVGPACLIACGMHLCIVIESITEVRRISKANQVVDAVQSNENTNKDT
jgi:hypothetical protein